MAGNPPKKPLSFEEFKHVLAEQLKVEEGKITQEASFIEDLMVDSIQLVDLMLSLEEMGIEIPLEAAWDVETVGDAYQVYQRFAV
jgi:acyl carrier protein